MKSKELVKLLIKYNSPESEVNICQNGRKILSIKEVLLVNVEGYASTTKGLANNEILIIGIPEK